VVPEDLLQVLKDIVGQRRDLEQLSAGKFFWEGYCVQLAFITVSVS
jgi:hypothetical protein